MLLVIEEEETLVAPDGASHRATELVAVQPARLGQEKVASVKHVVAPELEERPVKAVGARLRNQTYLSEGCLPQLGCIGVGLHLELLDGVNGRFERDIAKLPRVVAGPVQREVVLVVASADGDPRTAAAGGRSDREIESAGTRSGSGRQQQQLREVTAIERDLRGIAVVDNLANDGILGLQLRCLRAHRDRFGYGAHFQRDVEPGLLINLDDDTRDRLFLEAGDFRRDAVLPDLQQRHDVIAILIAGSPSR